MQPFWITFERLPRPSVLNIGMGCTARTEADARLLVKNAVPDMAIQTIKPVTDLSSLDQGHVLPNMGDISQRGIWFPMGF